jgi:tetratricopeptide (TPR) repeat protein
LGNLLVARGNAAAALPNYLEAARLHPADGHHWETVGKQQLVLDRGEDAKASFERAMELRRIAALSPDASARAKNAYAWSLLTSEIPELRRPNEALEQAVQANQMTEYGHPTYLDTLALAYSRNGRVHEAVDTQRKAVSILPQHSQLKEEFSSRLAEYETAARDTRESD